MTDDAVEWLTYRQLAERLDMSVDAARMRVQRAKWRRMRNNQGAVLVGVPQDEMNEKLERQAERKAERSSERSSERTETPEAFVQELIGALKQQITGLEAERDRVLADLERERKERREERAAAFTERGELLRQLAAALEKMPPPTPLKMEEPPSRWAAVLHWLKGKQTP